MDKKEYLKRRAALTEKIDRLYDQCRDLDNEYIREYSPCKKGDIVEITFTGSDIKGVIGVVCDENFLYHGEFRPSLIKFRDDCIVNKRIYYDGKAPINIKVLGKAPTCSECLWRKIHNDKIYCSLAHTGTGEPYYVEPDKMMCEFGSYVKWEGNIPWKQSIKKNIINKKAMSKKLDSGRLVESQAE